MFVDYGICFFTCVCMCISIKRIIYNYERYKGKKVIELNISYGKYSYRNYFLFMSCLENNIGEVGVMIISIFD